MSSLVVESAALMVVVAAVSCATLSLRTSWRRRLQHSQLQAVDLDHFREAAQGLLREVTRDEVKGRPGWNGFRKFTIDRKVEETVDVTSFYLKPYDGKPIPRYLPGQHLTFRLRIPGQARPVFRCYSLSDAPGESDCYRVTVKRLAAPIDNADAPDGLASCFLHDIAEEGHIVDVRAPSGAFQLDSGSTRPAVLIAGGIGLTPLLSMLDTICASGGALGGASGGSSGRETWLFYGVRNRADHVMYEHLQRVRRRYAHINIVVCYSAPTPCCVQQKDYDHHGRVSIELIRRLVRATDCQFYLCGPAAMQETLIQDLRAWGVAEHDIQFERFGNRPKTRTLSDEDAHWDTAAVNGVNSKVAQLRPRETGAVALLQGGDASERSMVEVVFARSGKVARWQPGGASLLKLAETLGVPIETGCRSGQCGSCATSIRRGDVTYPVQPGCAPDRGSCLPCVAIPKNGLVLDA